MPDSDTQPEPQPVYVVPEPEATAVDPEEAVEAAREAQADRSDPVDAAADQFRPAVSFSLWVAALQRLADAGADVEAAKAVVGAPPVSSRDLAGASSAAESETAASAVWGTLYQEGYSPRQAVEGAAAAAAFAAEDDAEDESYDADPDAE